MSSISSNELFPPIGWSASANGSASTFSCLQTVPVDVRRAESECSLADSEAHWDLILDQTALGAGFDTECLDGLDEMLLLAPVDAFAALCWDTAIQIPGRLSKSPMKSPQRQRPAPLPSLPKLPRAQKSTVSFPRRRPAPLIAVTESSSEGEESGYDSGSDEVRTLKDEFDEMAPLASPVPSSFMSSLSSSCDTFRLSYQPTVEPIRLIKYSCLPYEIDASFILFESQHAIDYYSEHSAGLSPFHTEHRKATKVDRIAAFCANLPTRLLRVAS